MNIDEINKRFTVIEKVWKDATGQARSNYLTELEQMSADLAKVAGAQADSARWLTRRISRVVRYIDDTPS